MAILQALEIMNQDAFIDYIAFSVLASHVEVCVDFYGLVIYVGETKVSLETQWVDTVSNLLTIG
jgi:hypothetical protein